MSGDSFDLETFREYVARSDDHIVLNMAPDVIAEVESLRADIARLRLTDSERNALTATLRALYSTDYAEEYVTLRGLLERHKGGGE